MIDLDYELRIKGQFDPEFFSISSTGCGSSHSYCWSHEDQYRALWAEGEDQIKYKYRSFWERY